MLKKGVEEIFKDLRKYKPSIFDSGIGARLPAAYRKFYDEWRNTPCQPVHYIPQKEGWIKDEKTGEIKRTQNVPLPGIHPKEMNDVFTGGEMIIFGYKKKSEDADIVPRFWTPAVYKSVVYTEILNKYLSVKLTKRVVELIHQHHGFDNYLMQTKACDLRTLVALKLKKRLLEALKNKNLPYDDEKNEIIYEKYKNYILPEEELEWYGLTFTEACRKQEKIEEFNKKASIVPLKHVYRLQLLEQLKTKKNENTAVL